MEALIHWTCSLWETLWYHEFTYPF